MGMAGDQFSADARHHLVKVKMPRILGDAGMKDNLHEDIPQFLRQFVRVLGLDGVNRLIGFLQHIALDALMALLPVPGTTLITS